MFFAEISSDPNKDIFLFVFYAKGMKTVLNFPKKIDFCMKRAKKGFCPQGYRNFGLLAEISVKISTSAKIQKF